MPHTFKIDQIQCLPVGRVEFLHAKVQHAAPLVCLHDGFDQRFALRLLLQLLEAEDALPPLLLQAAKRKMTRRLIKIGTKSAVADMRFFGNKIGKGFNHQVFCLVDIMEVAVDIQGQTVAVAFHQDLQSVIVTA